MQKIWRQYQFGLDYIAGGDFYAGPKFTTATGRATQVHTFAANQRILWRTGQLAIRDSFDYLPEGTFGFSSYGGAGSFGSAIGGGVSGTGLGGGLAGGTAGGLGSIAYGSIGYQPRIDNSAVVDVVQGLSPRSTVTLAGGYNFTDYLNKSSAPFPIINSQETTGQVGFNRLLNRRDQVGVQYAFQEFHFPSAGSGSVQAHVWDALYGHRISGKLNFTVAGGPQFVILHNAPINLGGIFFSHQRADCVSALCHAGLRFLCRRKHQRDPALGGTPVRAALGYDDRCRLFAQHQSAESDFDFHRGRSIAFVPVLVCGHVTATPVGEAIQRFCHIPIQ
jgi:hypothetical protein